MRLDVRSTVEELFREESGRVLAGLIRTLGDFDLAEEALQNALADALETWPKRGIPDNPAAWITRAARNRAIDRLRRTKKLQGKLAELEERAQIDDDGNDTSIEDDRLRLIFTCCHPALSLEARLALTLRTLGGLNTAEIARAFLVPETTMAQRLVRAKKKIKLAGIPYQVPDDHLLPDRLASVLWVIYLIFNEGYTASSGTELIRRDLALKAIRLGRVLTQLMPDEPEASGLLALMLLQDSRWAARTDETGSPVLLEDQDRSKWDRDQITEGLDLLNRASRREPRGRFVVQAAIAAEHAKAHTAETTDWPKIAELYDELSAIDPSPVVELNRAVAVAMAHGPAEGVRLIEELEAARSLDGYYLLHSAKADLLRRMGSPADAAVAYEKALALAGNQYDKRFLQRRLEEMRAQT